jgi:putative transposase
MRRVVQKNSPIYGGNLRNVGLNQVGSLPLDIRTWRCENCLTTHDRDVNAAINLRDEGLRILTADLPGFEIREASGSAFRTSGTGDKAYRPDVRPSSRGRKKSTVGLSVG